MWGLTAQNEPIDGNIPEFGFNCMGWNASTQATWIGLHLGPTLDENGYDHLKLMAFDDQRPLLFGWSNEIMEDELASQYVDGWAVHWYTDFLGLPGVLDYVHEQYPEKFILFTEACTGANPWDLQKVLLGSWERGQEYINDILTNLNHWSTGWTDWNLGKVIKLGFLIINYHLQPLTWMGVLTGLTTMLILQSSLMKLLMNFTRTQCTMAWLILASSSQKNHSEFILM